MGETGNTIERATIVWQGRPALLPFFATAFLSAAVGVAILCVTVATLLRAGPQESLPLELLLLAPFVVVGVALAVCFPLYRIVTYVCLLYVITDKRVLLRSGIIERETQMVDFGEVASAWVRTDLLDVIFGFWRTGSLTFVTRGPLTPDRNEEDARPYVLSHVVHPYDVFRFFQRAEYDVKADLEYPNALRPEKNAGYTTTYTPIVKS